MKLITPFQDMKYQIEALLKKIEATRGTAQRCEYAHRVNELRAKAETILLNILAKHGEDITTKETNALWAPLDYSMGFADGIHRDCHSPCQQHEDLTQSGQQTSTGKISYRPQNTDTVVCFTRLKPPDHRLHHGQVQEEPA